MKLSEFALKVVGVYYMQSGVYDIPLDLAYRLIEEFEELGMLPPNPSVKIHFDKDTFTVGEIEGKWEDE